MERSRVGLSLGTVKTAYAMFTGLIETVGRVLVARKIGRETDLDVDLGFSTDPVAIGDSIALSGVCCTVTAKRGTQATFRLSEETLRRTWFGTLKAGAAVNVERALCAGQPLGGHYVQGHVDGRAEVLTPVDARRGGEFWFQIPSELQKYCVEKGSIAVDGISLTLAALRDGRGMIAIIPHTADVTTLGSMRRGQAINLEVDILAKYVESILGARAPS